MRLNSIFARTCICVTLGRVFHSSVRGEIGLLGVRAGFVTVVAIELLVLASVAVIVLLVVPWVAAVTRSSQVAYGQSGGGLLLFSSDSGDSCSKVKSRRATHEVSPGCNQPEFLQTGPSHC